MATKNKAFLMFYDYGKQFELLSREERGDLIMLLFRNLTGSEEDTNSYSQGVQIAYSFMFPAIKRSIESYENTCRRRSEAALIRESKKRQSKEE
jgi:hypothetical protein